VTARPSHSDPSSTAAWPSTRINDAQRLRADPAIRTVVGGRARDHAAASTSEVGRLETETLTTRENLNRVMGLTAEGIDRAHRHRKLTRIVLDMDRSVTETYGQQQGSAFNGHYGRACYLLNEGTIGHARQIAAHESPKATKPYGRASDPATPDEVARNAI
jgi:hypothetical protein